MKKWTSKAVILRTALFLLFGAIVFVIFECYERSVTSDSDIIGKYISNYEQANFRQLNGKSPELQGIHKLELKDIGVFDYSFTSFDGKENFNNSGLWEFQSSLARGTPGICLSKFAFGPKEFQIQKKQMDTSLPVRRSLGGIRIIINEDYGYYFQKYNE